MGKPQKKQRTGERESQGRAALMQLLPVHSCMAAANLAQNGIGNAIFSRKLPDGNIVSGVFLVDIFCLGIKDAMLMNVSRQEHDTLVALTSISDPLKDVEPCCLKKLLEQAASYASGLGIPAHKDYKKAAFLLEGIDSSACKTRYEFGYDGKPFFIPGPNDTPARIRRICETLRKNCGEGGYDFLEEMDDPETGAVEEAASGCSIDNPKDVEELLVLMNDALPFKAQIRPEIFESIRTSYERLSGVKQNVDVTAVSYRGDEGGIMCHLAFGQDAGENPLIMSLTHMMPDENLPFYKKIHRYQKRRCRKLQGG